MIHTRLMNDGGGLLRKRRESAVRCPRLAARKRAKAMAFLLALLALLCAAIGVSDMASQQWSDVSKIAAVAFFVGAMVAVALGMIGDAYYHR